MANFFGPNLHLFPLFHQNPKSKRRVQAIPALQTEPLSRDAQCLHKGIKAVVFNGVCTDLIGDPTLQVPQLFHGSDIACLQILSGR